MNRSRWTSEICARGAGEGRESRLDGWRLQLHRRGLPHSEAERIFGALAAEVRAKSPEVAVEFLSDSLAVEGRIRTLQQTQNQTQSLRSALAGTVPSEPTLEAAVRATYGPAAIGRHRLS